MSLARLVQNFSQRRALVASPDRRAVEALSATLAKLGLEVEEATGAQACEALLSGLEPARDVLFVDGDLTGPASPFSALAGALPPAPVIGLVGAEAPSRLKALLMAGATAFLQKPVYGGAVYSALYLGVNEHARRAAQEAAIDELQTRRRQRRHVIKAVVRTMALSGLDDEAAYQILRREAMRERLGLEAYCERLVLAAGTPDDEPVAAKRLQAAAD
ncbi:ANTAR domain-containing protein [Aurantimonas sp. Leaf443]|uniref:ANTAR domain-containing response regulator n=1 Tax=Aurantimonas sp. Leaf443 TaxID=1736378 RepID=UPI0006F50482|nr:ANTAR domain-containing protein [Aurantimonas sp. Leaf443]KQT84134.1 hypothetical protein ASG48_12285 [Aurantimonas sp. Leaf443]